MLNHRAEFEKLGVPASKLMEVAEAATTRGYYGGIQPCCKAPGRPIFGLFFHGKPLAVAISIGTNGFIVGMNSSNLSKLLETAKLSRDDLRELHSWC
jgi:hypothetical protein